MTQRLTINAGLRWDVEGAPTERYNRMNAGWNFSAADPALAAAAKKAGSADCPPCANLTGGLLFANVNGAPRPAFSTGYTHWQPRIGAAYQLAPRTVLRGGFGIFYLPESFFGAVQGFAADTPFVATSDGGVNAFIPANTLSNPFPNGINPAHRSIARPCSIRRQQCCFHESEPVREPVAGTGLNGATVSRSQLLRPFPQFGSVLEYGESVGKMWYDAFQLSVEKRYTQGLVLAYTWSKNLEAVDFLNPQDPAPAKTYTAVDRPQRLVLSGVYELPFGRGRLIGKSVNRGWNMLIVGWEYTFIGTIQSGTPVNLPGNVDLIANPTVSGQSFASWFTTAWRTQAASPPAEARGIPVARAKYAAHHSVPDWFDSQPEPPDPGHVAQQARVSDGAVQCAGTLGGLQRVPYGDPERSGDRSDERVSVRPYHAEPVEYPEAGADRVQAELLTNRLRF